MRDRLSVYICFANTFAHVARNMQNMAGAVSHPFHRSTVSMQQPSPIKHAVTEVAAPENTGIAAKIHLAFRTTRSLHEREQARLREEIARIPGLMTLLMKPRNGMRWTKTERRELQNRLRRLSRLSIYLAMAALPFTMFTLPLVAWWLDRRTKKRG